MTYLEEIYYKCERKIEEGDYTIIIPNKSNFKDKYVQPYHKKNGGVFKKTSKAIEEYFEFNNNMIISYVFDFLLYKWLKDHGDSRYKDFSCILKPCRVRANLKSIPFQEIFYFVSPASKRADEKSKESLASKNK